MRKSAILVILIFLIILGFGLIIIALVFIFPHPLPVSKPESFYYDPPGFLFWSSENLTSQESSLIVRFENLTCDKGEVDVNVHVHYYITEEENDGIAYFILQIPYTPENVSVEAPVWPPSYVGGDFNVSRFEEIAFLLIWIPRENIKSGLNYMNVTFTLNDSIYRLNYFTYEMDITFSTGFHESAKKLSYFEIIRGKGYKIYLFAAKEMTMDVERPQFYVISETTPTNDHVAAFGGKTWFRWDIKKMGSPSFRSNLVIIEFEHPEEEHKYEVRYSATWLMLGMGIPLAVSSFFELVKSKNETNLWKLVKTSKILWLFVLILIFIFHIIYWYLVRGLNVAVIAMDELTRWYVGLVVSIGSLLVSLIVAFFLYWFEKRRDDRLTSQTEGFNSWMRDQTERVTVMLETLQKYIERAPWAQPDAQRLINGIERVFPSSVQIGETIIRRPSLRMAQAFMGGAVAVKALAVGDEGERLYGEISKLKEGQVVNYISPEGDQFLTKVKSVEIVEDRTDEILSYLFRIGLQILR